MKSCTFDRNVHMNIATNFNELIYWTLYNWWCTNIQLYITRDYLLDLGGNYYNEGQDNGNEESIVNEKSEYNLESHTLKRTLQCCKNKTVLELWSFLRGKQNISYHHSASMKYFSRIKKSLVVNDIPDTWCWMT